ncbi:hypothetical protein ACLMJK_004318 [Lecanora helva]
MNSFGSNTPTVNGVERGKFDDRPRAPRVHLPPPQPRVNLPHMSAQSNPMPSNQYYSPSAAPKTMSYDQSFPVLGASQPQIKMPAEAPIYPPQQSPSNLEDHLRGMILNNDSSARSNFAQQYPASQEDSQRLYQPWRRQRYGQTDGDTQQYQKSFQRRPPILADAPSHQSYSRPGQLRKQLYDPAATGSFNQQRNRNHIQRSTASVQAQVGYLDLAVHIVIPKVEMSLEEYNEKDRLRAVLEKICRRAVFDHESTKRGPHFKAESVELKCFGSMSTTFATKASDMDLVLVSPLSEASAPGSEIPRIIEKALLDSGYGVRLLTKTRVPIIRFCERPTPELKDLLLQERVKFENERDAPPPVIAKKTEKKSKKSEKERPDPTLPQNRPNDPSVQGAQPAINESLQSAKSVSQEVQNTGEPRVSGPLSTDDQPSGDDKGCHEEAKSRLSVQAERQDPSLLEKSDEDRAKLYRLAIKEGWYEPAERDIINSYLSTIGRRDVSEHDKVKARTPLQDLPNVIGRYRPPPEAHPLEFPKTGVGIQCDINFSNHLALHNSHLLKCYSLCDHRVRTMVLFVKAWAKKRKINSPYHGTLSSYGYVLMVLHYLVNVAQPSVLPNLQNIPLAFEDEISANVIEMDGHNVQFLRNETLIETFRSRQDPQRNMESVGSLLRGFFHYFAQQGYYSPCGGFVWSLEVLSLRTIGGILSKQAKDWTGAKTETVEMYGPGSQQTKDIRQRYLFAIEDPFEIEHNIARTVVHNGIVAIRDEFRRAHRLIEHGGLNQNRQMEDLLEEAADRENLQYRAFGPRPRNGPDRKGNSQSQGEKADDTQPS